MVTVWSGSVPGSAQVEGTASGALGRVRKAFPGDGHSSWHLRQVRAIRRALQSLQLCVHKAQEYGLLGTSYWYSHVCGRKRGGWKRGEKWSWAGGQGRVELDLDAYPSLCHGSLSNLMKSMDTFSEECVYMYKMQYIRLQRNSIFLRYNSILGNTLG